MNAPRRMPMTCLAVATVSLTLLVAMSPPTLQAGVIYSNFIPGYVPCCSGSLVRGPDYNASPGLPYRPRFGSSRRLTMIISSRKSILLRGGTVRRAVVTRSCSR